MGIQRVTIVMLVIIISFTNIIFTDYFKVDIYTFSIIIIMRYIKKIYLLHNYTCRLFISSFYVLMCRAARGDSPPAPVRYATALAWSAHGPGSIPVSPPGFGSYLHSIGGRKSTLSLRLAWLQLCLFMSSVICVLVNCLIVITCTIVHVQCSAFVRASLKNKYYYYYYFLAWEMRKERR